MGQSTCTAPPWVEAEAPPQARRDDVDHQVGDPLGVVLGEQEGDVESLGQRQAPRVDAVGVSDHDAVPCLPEDPGQRLARASATTDRTVKLLPQPGPMSTATGRVSGSRTAALFSGARVAPVQRCSQRSAASQSTGWERDLGAMERHQPDSPDLAVRSPEDFPDSAMAGRQLLQAARDQLGVDLEQPGGPLDQFPSGR
jgi:hypothetical protein